MMTTPLIIYTECLKCGFGLFGSVCLHADRAIVAHSVEGAGDVQPVHLSGPGLTAPGIVGNLNFPDPRQAGLSPADHVALANLRVVKVKIDAKARSVDR
jgi:hypothetical protein